ncbi:hypothetical protein Tco_1215614 [Tanacetum coccineum]
MKDRMRYDYRRDIPRKIEPRAVGALCLTAGVDTLLWRLKNYFGGLTWKAETSPRLMLANAEHRARVMADTKAIRLLVQPKIPSGSGDNITMDFIAKLPRPHLMRHYMVGKVPITRLFWARGGKKLIPNDWSGINPGNNRKDRPDQCKGLQEATGSTNRATPIGKRKQWRSNVGDVRVMLKVSLGKESYGSAGTIPQELSSVHHTFPCIKPEEILCDEPYSHADRRNYVDESELPVCG